MCNRRRGQPSPYKCAALKRVRLTSNASKLVFAASGRRSAAPKSHLKRIVLPSSAKVAATSSHFQQRAFRTVSEAADHGSEQSNGVNALKQNKA